MDYRVKSELILLKSSLFLLLSLTNALRLTLHTPLWEIISAVKLKRELLLETDLLRNTIAVIFAVLSVSYYLALFYVFKTRRLPLYVSVLLMVHGACLHVLVSDELPSAIIDCRQEDESDEEQEQRLGI